MNHTKNKLILLVEDEAFLAMVQADLLRSFGYSVSLASTAAQAVEIGSSPEIDLILMDINLGAGPDGARAAAQILEKRRVPIVFLTSHTERELIEPVMNLSGYGFVMKGSGDFVLQSSIEMAFRLFEAQRRAEENEQKYRTVADFTYDWEYWLGPDGQLLYISPACERITGYSRSEFEQNPELLFQILHPEDQDRVTRHIQSETSTHADIDHGLRYRIVTKTGQTRWIHHECTPVCDLNQRYMGRRSSNRDITELVWNKNEQEKNEKRLREAGRIAHLGYYEIDLSTGSSVWSEEIFNLFGLDPVKDSPTADSYRRHVHPDDVEELYRRFNDSIQHLIPFDMEYRILTESGEVRHVHSTARVETGPDGQPKWMFGTLLDITRSKEIEGEVRRLLHEKEILMREIHHRIKNNLTVITTLLMLQAGEMSDPVAIEALQDARGRIVSMMAVYDRLYRGANFKQVNIQEYLTTLLQDIRESWQGVGGQVAIQTDIASMPVDHSLVFPIGVIVNELVTNAYKYAYPRGTTGLVEVYLQPQEGEPAENRRLLLSVTDHGQSLPETVDFDHPATFGLNLVKLLSEQIQARVDLSTGNGTGYRFEIPY